MASTIAAAAPLAGGGGLGQLELEPSENWDDDFEFNPSASPSPAPPSPSSSRRHQQHYQQQQQQLYTLSGALSPGTRLSIASSEYTMEDWDAESAFGAGSSPPRMEGDEEEFNGSGVHTPTRNRSPREAGSSSPKRRLDDAVPVPISLALAAWSEEPELVLPRTPMKRAVGLEAEENAHQHLTLARHSSQVGLVSTEEAENWDDDFEDEGTRKAVSPPSAGLSLKKREEEDEEVAHESWDEEFAAEEEAQQKQQMVGELGMGPPPPASRRTPRKSPTLPRRGRKPSGSELEPRQSSSSSSASESENHHARFSGYKRQKARGHSERTARYSLSEDGDFYDSSDSDSGIEDEFGVRMKKGRPDEDEEDKTVTARSRKGVARVSSSSFREAADGSPPPPVPRLPSTLTFLSAPPSQTQLSSPSSPNSASTIGALDPSLSPSLSFSPPPLPHASSSSPHPFPRSPTSSVFSVPVTVRSYTSTTALTSAAGRSASRASSKGLGMLPPSPPIHKDRERRRLRKKSRPSGGAMEMRDVSGNVLVNGEGYGYSFSDGELDDIRERERERGEEEGAAERILPRKHVRECSRSPGERVDGDLLGVGDVTVVGGAGLERSPVGSVKVKKDAGGEASVPATPKSGAAGALLSRIGSVTRTWGGRRGRKSRGDGDDVHMTPRPQSSSSSLHPYPAPSKSPAAPTLNVPSPGALSVASSSSHQQSNTPSPGQQNGASSSWFFRSASTQSGASGTSYSTRASGPKPARKSVGGYSQRSGRHGDGGDRIGGVESSAGVTTDYGEDDDEGEEGQHTDYGRESGVEREKQGEFEWRYHTGGELDDRTPVATPSKLVKRKSLGFVQLRRNAGLDGSGAAPGTAKKKRASDIYGETPKKGGLWREKEWAREEGGDPFIVPPVPFASTSSQVTFDHLATPPSSTPPKEKEGGLRGIMGNVRRLSIVGVGAVTKHRHKRTQSSSAVPGGSTSPNTVSRTSLSNSVLRPGSRGAGSGAGVSPTPIRVLGAAGVGPVGMVREASRESGNTSGSGGRPLTPSTSVPAMQKMYAAGAGVKGIMTGRKRSGSIAVGEGVGRRVSNKENEGEGSGMRDRREGLDGDVEGRPSMSMLLPPIELQPPSPPRKSREKEKEYATLGSASTMQGENKLTLSPPLVDGGEPRTPGKPRRSPSSPQSASVGRASPLTPPSRIDFGRDPSAPSVSASASDSTTSSSNNNGDANPNSATTVKDKSKPPSNASTVKAREASAVLRRNSLGDLKIPARISQAQVSLRRDLGMVREFAGAVESLKGLQDTYNCLTGEIHALMERRAAEAGQAAAAARQVSASHTPTSPDREQSSRATSPMGFFNLANLSRTHLGLGGRKGRKRSNTNPEGMPRSSSDGMVGIRTSMLGSTTDLGVQVMSTSSSSPLVSSQAAYKELATALYTINSKYRISWECAELLIELGGGTKDSADGAGSDNTNSKGNPISPTATAGPSHSGISNMASASAVALPVSVSPGMQRSTSKNSTRERAVTLAGDDRSPTPVSRPGSRVGSYGASHNHYAPPLSSPLHSSTGGGFDAAIVNASSSTPAVPAVPSAMGPPGPPLASPSNWRASTGRHDLSQRQLTLLKEMLSQEGPVRGAPNFNAAAYSRLSIAEEPSPPSHMKGTAGQPNREWRWGADAMGSTVTLPASDDEEEGEGGHGTDRTGSRMSGHHAAGKQPKKKRLMNMSGFRDMLRALRRGAQMATPQPPVVASGPVEAHQGQQALLARTRAAASTTSLSAGSSYEGHSAQGHGYRSPTQGQTRRTLIQKRRPRSSAGGEEVLAQQQRASGTTTPLSPPISQQQHQPPPPPSSFSMPMPVPPKSPRRPSLASIFRIGTSSKNAPPQPFQPGNATDSGSSYLGEEDYTRRRVNPDVDDEEEWDQIDSASDLDGVAGVAGMDATIRGGSVSNPKVLEKKRKKLVVVGSKANAPPGIGTEKGGDVVAVPEKSPYLQQDPYAHRSTSGLGRRIVSAGAAPHSSASSTSINMNASQTSLAESIKESNAPVVPPGNTTNSVNGSMRQAKLSDVQENDAGEAATRASLSLSRQTGQALLVQKGPNPHHGAGNRSVSSSSRFSNANKTGSVRSMPPQPFSPSSISSGSNIVSPYSGAGSAGSGYPDIKLTFTPENIRPLLENAREVQARLKECVEEMRVLVRREEGRSRGAQVDLGVP